MRQDNKIYFLDEFRTKSSVGKYFIKGPESISLIFDKPIGDCKNASPIEFSSRNTFNLLASKNWIGLKSIIVNRSTLYKSNNSSSQKKGYLVKHDIVKVIKQKEDWVYIEYENFSQPGHKPILAWIKLGDCIDK